MHTNRLSSCIVVAVSLCLLSSTAIAQRKYTITETPDSDSKYTQEHVIDVGDVLGHQIRIYELHFTYPKKDVVFGDVPVKESYTRGISDYTNGSGPFKTYNVYILEDGNTIITEGGGTSQVNPTTDGSKPGRKFTFVDHFVSGTGKFAGIRGQQRGTGERAAGADSITEQSSGEYWIAK